MNYFDVLFAKKQSGGGGTPTLITKSITENGTYDASSDNADGYSQVTVNVPYMEKKSASGDIASFSDGAGYPFLKVKANINPVQDLHGYDYPWVGGAGKNKINVADMHIIRQVTINVGTLPAGTYVASATVKNNSNIGGQIQIRTDPQLPSSIIASALISDVSGTNRVATNSFTLSEPTNISIVVSGASSGYDFDMSQMQIELGSTATSFAPYSNICPISGFTGVNVTISPTTTEGSGTVYPISWQDEAGIVYGGYIDLVSGVLTVTKVGIAEYNGETLPSAWISDRDRYVAGNTPTIGAQVVYDLATPQTYQLTSQQINTLIRQNNVWNNTNGQTEVEYFIPIE